MLNKLPIASQKAKITLAGITVIALTVYWFWQGQRDQKISELIAEAGGSSTGFLVARDPVNAVQMLAEFDNADAREAILLMASARPDTLPMGVQEEAIRALANQNTTEACHVLAQVLQSYFLADYRAEAAKLLAKKKCDKLTVVYALHYLNQIANGEGDLESRLRISGQPAVPEQLTRERQNAVERNLFRMLDANRRTTAEVLTELYGIGTNSPTTFAIHLIRKGKFGWACSGLVRSQQLISSRGEDMFIAPRSEMQEAIHSLNCLETAGQ